MAELPQQLDTPAELDDFLSRPTPVAVKAMQVMEGDLLILGVGGKMGPSLARLARRAADEAGRSDLRVIGVSRFRSPQIREELESHGIETIAADLLEETGRAALPNVANVLLMTAFKFGAAERPDLAWATNCYLPGLLAELFRQSRLVCFSTGNVYPLVPVDGLGASEAVFPDPVGEYGITALGRERLLQYVSHQHGTPVSLIRLNYAVELRYGVPVDIGLKLLAGEPIDLSTSHVNIVWQGYANAVTLGCFALAQSPADILNLTGPGVLRVRELATGLAERLDVEPTFTGEERSTAYLNDASRCHELFGVPAVGADKLLDWIAHWLKTGGMVHGKPTKFQVRDGKY